MSSTNDFVNRIVEATDAGEWSQAIDVWNEMTEKYLENDDGESIRQVYGGVSAYGINMSEVLKRALDK